MNKYSLIQELTDNRCTMFSGQSTRIFVVAIAFYSNIIWYSKWGERNNNASGNSTAHCAYHWPWILWPVQFQLIACKLKRFRLVSMQKTWKALRKKTDVLTCVALSVSRSFVSSCYWCLVFPCYDHVISWIYCHRCVLVWLLFIELQWLTSLDYLYHRPVLDSTRHSVLPCIYFYALLNHCHAKNRFIHFCISGTHITSTYQTHQEIWWIWCGASLRRLSGNIE